MSNYVKLPFQFDAEFLKQDLAKVAGEEQKHRVENNGDKDRIHLVIECKVNNWLVKPIK